MQFIYFALYNNVVPREDRRKNKMEVEENVRAERCNAYNSILKSVRNCIEKSKNQAIKEELMELREMILNQYWKD